ncbi:MAG: prephenate dehydrogenase/arogenate dehydrogenase family protein [Anaerolineales bacterium]|nr:prephenate dehydrogenase/arogenate dehydrogenase family protein [Anaerolineales bacterium]
MTKATITIIGLGKRGTSVGLALKQKEAEINVIGHDKDNGVAKKAKGMEAVDSTSWNLISACEPADVIVLTIPSDQVKATLKALGPQVSAGCVVLDTSSPKQLAVEWAAKYLDKEAHFVGIAPGLNPEAMEDQSHGPEGAKADLFANSPCCVVPAADCHPDAVKTAQDFAFLLGGDPYFLDPVEFDGLSTAVNLMPKLVSGALFRAITDSPGWREMRRLSSVDLLQFSQPLESSEALAQAAIQNKISTLRWLELTIESLQAMRSFIYEEDETILNAMFESMVATRDEWLAGWKFNRWEKSSAQDMPSTGGMMGQFLGLGRSRKTGDKK